MMTYNRADIEVLQDNASSMTCEEFVEWVKENCDWREPNESLIDFDYGSITASINKYHNCLCGGFDYYDNDGQWIDSHFGEMTRFK
jgi:hypothetical protein